jgi:hypothetical protein
MTPIPFLSPAPAMPVLPGVAPVAAAGAVDFAALLPPGTVPVMPRQGDAEGGKGLPAIAIDEEEPAADPAAAWITPPAWRAICPPAVAPATEGDGTPAANPLAPSLRGDTTKVTVTPRNPDLHQGTDPTLASSDPAPALVAAVPGVRPVSPRPLHSGDAPAAGAATGPTTAGPLPEIDPPHAAASARVPALPTGVRPVSPRSVHPGAVQGPAAGPTTAGPLPVISPERGAAPASPPAAPLAEPAPASSPSEGQGTAKTGAADIAAVSLAPTSAPKPEAAQRPTSGKDQPAPAAAQPAALQQPADPLQPARIAPAAQIFAAAIHQAVRDERRIDTPEPTIAAIAPTTDLAPHAVTAAENSRQAALDMARETWPAKMIERIEMMRDAIDAVDTSIRLVPDKLGTIDVSLKQDGDTVQVHFTAQQAETRQLLAEAQPKLAELADAKGLKLSAQLGDGGGQQHQQRAPAGPQHTTTNRPSRAASNDDAAAADERIA